MTAPIPPFPDSRRPRLHARRPHRRRDLAAGAGDPERLHPGLDRSAGRRWFLFLFGCASAVAGPLASGQDLHLAGELRTSHQVDAFAGQPIRLSFHHISGVSAEWELALDVYQEANELALPLVKDLLPHLKEPGDGAVTEASFEWRLPEVKHPTNFRLLLKARTAPGEAWLAAGGAIVVGLPPPDWEDLRERHEAVTIWIREEGPVAEFLRERGFDLTRAGAAELQVQKGVVLWEDVVPDEEVPASAVDGQQILLFHPEVTGLPRVESRSAGEGWIGEIRFDFRDGLQQNPRAQQTLYEIIEAAFLRQAPDGRGKM